MSAVTLSGLFGLGSGTGGTFRERNGQAIPYGEMYADAVALAAALRKLRLPERFVAPIWMPPSAACYRAFMAVTLAGGIPVPLHAFSTPADVAAIATRLEAEALLMTEDGSARLGSLETSAPDYTAFVNGATGMAIRRPAIRARRQYEPPESTAAIFMTSGSSGVPKGVMLSQANLLANVEAIQAGIGLTPEDRVLVTKSFGYSSTITGEWLLALHAGASLELAAGIVHPLQLVGAAREAEATFICTVPAVLATLAKSDGWRPEELHRLSKLVVVGAAMPGDLLLRLQEKLPWTDIRPGYGLTEASPRVTCMLPGQLRAKARSAGTALAGVELAVCNEAGVPVASGVEGEIYVSGPNVMLGYYNDDERTDAALTARGLRTMDRGYIDEDGYLYLTGRSDFAFNVAGHLVHPETPELALAAHPDVREAAVAGLPDERLGFRPVAFVVLADGIASGGVAERLHAYCQHKLAAATRPKDIVFVSSLPQTRTGKLDRAAVQSMLRELTLPI